MAFAGISVLANPNATVYYDHSDSAYACSEPARLQSFTSLLSPALSHFRTTPPPPGKAASCTRLLFHELAAHNRGFMRRLRDWVLRAHTHTDTAARNSMAVRSLRGVVVCPFVRSVCNSLNGAIREEVAAV